MRSPLLLTLVLAALSPPAADAVTLYQQETFDTDGGWSSGAPNPFPPVLFPYFGPSGEDSALKLTASGSSGQGGKLVIFNTTTWSGDYLAAGITSIAADLRNLGSSDLAIRLALSGPGGIFVTEAATVTASSGWSMALFDLRPETLIAVEGASDANATMSSVNQIRLIHAPSAQYRGAPVSGVLLVDNLIAVPEPGALGLLAPALLLAFRRKR
ncbi:hypothetical protein [Luteolibacter marinus]|uniref:hypothetical protein n=1 Tax=Luteolibacter marinus TaxID=2776705 RepID=UPI00186849A6|nr:hypothetical protein [Luteolibacter marinus]